MRRVIFAMLVSLITPVVLLSQPANAVAKVAPITKEIIASRIRAVASPEVRTLVAEAHARSVSLTGLLREWEHVAVCEVNGNWSMVGPVYSGIGFLNSTWSSYGGQRYAPVAGKASKIEQILIGMRVTGGFVPDQNGCAPGGW